MTLAGTDKDGRAPENSTGLKLECKIHFKNGRRGSRRIRRGQEPAPQPIEPGNVPRISRLMALAIRFDSLIGKDAVRDYADLARLGHVSRARITQIMNLLLLAPDIQEDILFLPRTIRGRDPITERDVRPIIAVVDWAKQRRMWREIQTRAEPA